MLQRYPPPHWHWLIKHICHTHAHWCACGHTNKACFFLTSAGSWPMASAQSGSVCRVTQGRLSASVLSCDYHASDLNLQHSSKGLKSSSLKVNTSHLSDVRRIWGKSEDLCDVLGKSKGWVVACAGLENPRRLITSLLWVLSWTYGPQLHVNYNPVALF